MSNERKYQNLNLMNVAVNMVILAAVVVTVLLAMVGSLSFFAKASF